MFSRPILVTAFNRPDLLASLLIRLKQTGCDTVYISIDGPREVSDYELVAACRVLAEDFNKNHLDRLHFYQENQGCGHGMYGAINWFYSQESAGIILEDDINFDLLFLQTMDSLLDKFEFRRDIGSVTGLNPFSNYQLSKLGVKPADIIVHSFFSSWGWATWKDRWDLYNFEFEFKSKLIFHLKLYRRFGLIGSKHFATKFKQVARKEVDTWDYQFLAMQVRYGLKCAAPGRNLIANVGFRDDATHTKTQPSSALGIDNTFILDSNLNPDILEGRAVDKEYFKAHFRVLRLDALVVASLRRRLRLRQSGF